MVVEPRPAPALVKAEAGLLRQLPVVALDPPAQLAQTNHARQGRILGHGG
jgi:hypothetical protein